MPAFAYQAIDPQGRKAKGIIEAVSPAAARAALRAQRLLPVAVEPTGPVAASQRGQRRPGIGHRGLSLMTRQIATLVSSGIGVEQALKTVADQSGQPRLSALLLNLRSSVLDGRSFAQALGDYPQVFSDYYRASVAAGENAGQLDQVMMHLSAFVETQARNRQTVQLALLYPAILAMVSLAVIVALLVFVVPDIVRVFTSRGAELPWLTRALIAVSGFVSTWGLAAAAALGLTGAGGVWLLRQPAMRRRWHGWLARSRLTRAIVLKSNAAQFAGTLATLTVSRVPLVEALGAAAQTVPNLHIRAQVEKAALRVREGAALSTALTEAGVFPPMLLAMVASGEAAGMLGATLTRAAEDQARDLNAIVAALVALVEPAVLLLMGGIVMLLVLSIMLPIVNLNNLVG